jgi:hypothetical protein
LVVDPDDTLSIINCRIAGARSFFWAAIPKRLTGKTYTERPRIRITRPALAGHAGLEISNPSVKLN